MNKAIQIKILFLILSMNIYSQTKLTTIYYDNGEIRTQGTIDTINKLKVGIWKEFYPNGSIKSQQKCTTKKPISYAISRNSLKDIEQAKELKGCTCIKTGEWTDYHENNKISWKRNYYNGIRTGLETEYYSNGNIKSIGKNDHKLNSLFENSTRGKWKFYFENGNLKEIINYNKKGFISGKRKEYYENGKIRQILNYKDGSKEGKSKIYYENGKIRAKLNYKSGNRIGIYKIYYNFGKLKVSYEYNNIGKLMNVITCLDKNGNKLDCGTLKNGNGFINLYNDLGEFERKIEVIDGIMKSK